MKNLSIEELRRLEARTTGAYKRSKRAEAKQRNAEKLREIHGALQTYGEAPLYSLSTSEFRTQWAKSSGKKPEPDFKVTWGKIVEDARFPGVPVMAIAERKGDDGNIYYKVDKVRESAGEYNRTGDMYEVKKDLLVPYRSKTSPLRRGEEGGERPERIPSPEEGQRVKKRKDYKWVIEKQVEDLSAAERSDFLKHYQDYAVLVKDPKSGELKSQEGVIAQVEAAAKLLGLPLEKALDNFLDSHPEIVLRTVHVDVERALRFRHEELLEDPEQARETLLAVRTDIELAEFFGLTKRYLYYLTYGNKERYTSFEIPKKRGGTRKIDAPIPELKNVQRLLLDVLLNPAEMEDCVYGFRVGRSIVDNAKPHGGSAFVLNIDIKDFFPTIHFGRVKGFFQHRFGFPEEVAVLLAQLTTHNQILPQGAPTSPAIANLVCQKLDKRLARWAEKHEFQYTRYADDMTFSSNDGKLLTQIPFILKIVNGEGFNINPKKLRVMRRGGRQEVTGLVVNRKRPSLPRERLRWLRAVIHNCRKHGVASQAQKAIERWLLKPDGDEGQSEIVAFKNFLYGHAFYVYMVRPDLGAKMLAEMRKLDWPRQIKSPLGKPGAAKSSSAAGTGTRSRTRGQRSTLSSESKGGDKPAGKGKSKGSSRFKKVPKGTYGGLKTGSP